MNLNISWSQPTPAPSCGYKILYRRKSEATYTELDTSGTTSRVTVAAPASYEGIVESFCCNENVSTGTPFGINAYSSISGSTTITVGRNPQINITSSYGNPYSTIIVGRYTVSTSGSPVNYNFSITYPANTTSYSSIQSSVTLSGSQSIIAFQINTISPIFNKGGQIQQYDSVNTPPYFKYYWIGNTSGTTWNGAPISLPSFTLDLFEVTELATDNTTILAGNLHTSYILQTSGSTYSTVTFEVFDATNAVIGTVVASTTTLGLIEVVIPLLKVNSPLTSATQFTMKVYWPSGVLVDSLAFYLP
jgi:hypothetical protein